MTADSKFIRDILKLGGMPDRTRHYHVEVRDRRIAIFTKSGHLVVEIRLGPRNRGFSVVIPDSLLGFEHTMGKVEDVVRAYLRSRR